MGTSSDLGAASDQGLTAGLHSGRLMYRKDCSGDPTRSGFSTTALTPILWPPTLRRVRLKSLGLFLTLLRHVSHH